MDANDAFLPTPHRLLHHNESNNYKTLADYDVNLQLYQKNETCVILEETIAKCNSDGVSKLGSWELYLEEIDLKLALSSPLFLPFFYILAFMKYMSKKIVMHD